MGTLIGSCSLRQNYTSQNFVPCIVLNLDGSINKEDNLYEFTDANTPHGYITLYSKGQDTFVLFD